MVLEFAEPVLVWPEPARIVLRGIRVLPDVAVGGARFRPPQAIPDWAQTEATFGARIYSMIAIIFFWASMLTIDARSSFEVSSHLRIGVYAVAPDRLIPYPAWRNRASVSLSILAGRRSQHSSILLFVKGKFP